MAIISREALEALIIMIASMLLFMGLQKMSYITWLQQYPWVIMGIGAILVIFKKNITNTVGG